MRGRSRKALALLASCVVLVGGAVTTLAAWQDTEYVGLPLTLSQFDVQTSFDDVNWTDNEVSTNPKSLVLALSGALTNVKLTPGGSLTAWVGLRTAPKSAAATVTMSSFTVNATPGNDLGLLSTLSNGGPAVTYDATSGVSKAACQSGTFTGSSIATGLGLGSALTSSNATFTLPAGTDTAGGTSVGICFKVNLADNLNRVLGGAQISPVWQFNATSAS